MTRWEVLCYVEDTGDGMPGTLHKHITAQDEERAMMLAYLDRNVIEVYDVYPLEDYDDREMGDFDD